MSRRLELTLFSLILLLAAALRMGWPEITEFKRDEAALYSLALDVAELKSLPLRGIGSSVGLPNTPLSVYVFALPLFVWQSPLAATLWVGALNTASVALTYWMARRYWGIRTALIAALLYAAAPWAVIYSRKIWAQNLLPLFVVGYIFTALLALVEGKHRWLIAHFGLLAVVAQLHYSGLVGIPLTALWLIVFRHRVSVERRAFARSLAVGIALAVLLALPFGLYLAAHASGEAGKLVRVPDLETSAQALELAALVVMGTDIHALAGPQAFREYLASLPDFAPLSWLGGALVVAGVALHLRFWRSSVQPHKLPARHSAPLVLILWLLLPVLAFLPGFVPVFPHYFILLFPAPYLLTGLALDAAMRRFDARPVRVIGWLIPTAIAAAQVWAVAALLSFVGSRATPSGFGTPLGLLLRVADTVRAAPDVIIVSAGTNPNLDETPAIFHALLRDTPHRFVDGRTTAVIPAGEARAVLWPRTLPEALLAIYDDAASQETLTPLRWGEGEVRTLTISGAATFSPPYPRPAPALLTNGAEILGWGGEPGHWQLWWRVRAGSDEDTTLFAHLLDTSGNRVAQADVPTYPAAGWRTGDLVVSLFSLPGAGAMIRSGMYGSLSLAPVEVLDVAGNPAGQWIEFELDQ